MSPELQMEIVVAVGLGLGLAAAAGLRVFVPLLALGLAARAGLVPLAPGFEWLSSDPAMVALGTATLLEIAAYYVPWFDNLLDTISTPAAIAAGVLATASVLGDLPPWMQWGVAIVGGGSAAGLVAGSTSLLRLKSTVLTGGAGNFVVSTLELLGAVITSVIAILLPLAALLVVVLVGFIIYRLGRRLRAPGRAGIPPSASTNNPGLH
jgi:hypothetical protein